jgi:hypothetical protein
MKFKNVGKQSTTTHRKIIFSDNKYSFLFLQRASINQPRTQENNNKASTMSEKDAT